MDIVKWSISLSTLFLVLLILFSWLYSATSMPLSVLSGANAGVICNDENPDTPGCVPEDQLGSAFALHGFAGIMYLAMLFLAALGILISNLIASREVLMAKAGPKPLWLIVLWALPAIGALVYLFNGRKSFKAP